MIDGQGFCRCPTVLALKAVTTHDVAPCQLYLLVRHADIRGEPNDARQRICRRDTSQDQALPDFDNFGLRQHQKEDGLLDRADANRFIPPVEHEHLLAQRVEAQHPRHWVPIGYRMEAHSEGFCPHELDGHPGEGKLRSFVNLRSRQWRGEVMRVRAYLALENGAVFPGFAFGAVEREAAGEVVFNTAMTGYEEIVTDPSYCGQIVTFTYPHIGNYGITLEDGESDRVQVEGIVVHECSRIYSNWRARMGLAEYLAQQGVIGIEGVDTRMVVRMIRDRGAMRGVISALAPPEELVERARQLPLMEGLDLTDRVTTAAPYWWSAPAESTAGPLVVVVDYGVKRSILRHLAQRGCRVRVLPARTPAEEIVAMEPDGIVLSNGPGDPAAIGYAVEQVRTLLKSGVPILGICLGHQLLGLALGGRTYKLKFGHHGANHPVRNLRTGAVEITSQNHGFAVDPATLPPEVEITHINLNDGTLEGMRHREFPIMAVQYHPEAAPGPHDAHTLFDEFVAWVRAGEVVELS